MTGPAARLVRRQAAGPLPGRVAALAAGLRVEVVGPVPGGSEGDDAERLADGLVVLLASLDGEVVACVEGGGRELGFAAEVTAAEALDTLAAGGRLVVRLPRAEALRPLLDATGGSGRTTLILAAGTAGETLAWRLATGRDHLAVAAARAAVLHVPGRPTALFLHDPSRSGMPAASELAQPGGVSDGRDDWGGAHRGPGRGRLLAAVAAVAVAALVVAGAVRLGGGAGPGASPGSAPASNGSRTPSVPGPSGRVPNGGPSPAASAPALAEPLLPGPAPGGRQEPASAVDPATGITLLFGGVVDGLDAADTWTWEGGHWKQVVPSGAAHPPARHGAVLAPDATAAPGTFLLIGGQAGGRVLHDAWRWSPAGWTRLASADLADGAAANLASDPHDHTMVLVATVGAGTPTTLTLAGDAWTVARTSTPTFRLIATDPVTGVVGIALPSGGLDTGGESYRWGGASWIPLRPATEAIVDPLTATMLAPPVGSLVLVQNEFRDQNGTAAGTFTLTGGSWRPTGGPSPDFVRQFDSTSPIWGLLRGEAVIIGGTAGADAYRRASVFAGGAWQPVSAEALPPSATAAMAILPDDGPPIVLLLRHPAIRATTRGR